METTAYLPVVGKFRIPARYILLAQLGIAVLAAIGFVDLVRARAERDREPRPLWLLLLVPLGQMIWLETGFALNGFHPPERLGLRAIGILSFIAAFLLVCASARRVRSAFAFLVVFAAADQTFYAASYYARDWLRLGSPGDLAVHDNISFDRYPVMTLGAFDRLLADCPASGRERLAAALGDLPLIRGLRQITGYGSLTPRQSLDYRMPSALRVAGVRWRRRYRDGKGVWEELAEPLPYVRLVGRAVASGDPVRALEAIDPSTTAIVPEPLDLPPGDVGTAVLEAECPGHLEIITTAPAERLLVLADSYHPGWQAVLDGRRMSPIRAYGDFLGFVVPGGRRRVEFEFRPWSLRIGPSISLAAFGLTLALFGGSFASAVRRNQDPGRRSDHKPPEIRDDGDGQDPDLG